MSYSSYTASERRGIIAIALLSLLLIGSGIWLARCERADAAVNETEVEIPIVEEHLEFIDTTSIEASKKELKDSKDGKGRKKSKKKSSSKPKQEPRKRSPLDETV